MNLAIKKEINEEYVEAVELYEQELKENKHPSADIYINLGFLYWTVAEDHLFNIDYNVSAELSIRGGENFISIFEQGLVRYPRNIELHFWKKYCSMILLDGEFTRQDCEKLIDEYGNSESMIPYFYVSFLNNHSFIDLEEKKQLINKFSELAVLKNDYVLCHWED